MRFTFILTLMSILTMTTPLSTTAQSPRANSRDGSLFSGENIAYSVLRMREFMPTTNSPRGNQVRLRSLRYRLNEEAIDSLRFVPYGHKEPISFSESLVRNHVDGIIILHCGKVVYERYFGQMDGSSLHALMSVTKSFTGLLAATLVAEGKLDTTRTVAYYLPELAGSGFGDATVGQVMDMTTAIDYTEDYADPSSEVWRFSVAGNAMIEHPKGTPQGFHDYLATLRKKGTHGEVFSYRTVNTDVLGWIIERVGEAPIAQQLSHRIWSRMGMEQDAYYQVDAMGTAFAGGGLNAALRDLARVGEMIRCGGKWHGEQILPREAIEEIRFGGNRAAFAASTYDELLPGWSYNDMWWITGNANGAFMARGVHGQAIYIDPAAEMVLVRLSSNPIASNYANDPISLPAYERVAEFLMEE